MLINRAQRPAVTLDRNAVFTGKSTRPPEEADVEVLDRLHLNVAHPVLLRIIVLAVLPVAVVDGCLVPNQAAAFLAHGEEVALELQALVAAVLRLFTAAILDKKGRHVLGNLRITAKPHIPRIHRIIVGKATLELPNLHLKFLETRPFQREIAHGRVLQLQLDAVLEVAQNGARHVDTNHPGVEAVGALTVLARITVASDDVTAELRSADITGDVAPKSRLFIGFFRCIHRFLYATVEISGQESLLILVRLCHERLQETGSTEQEQRKKCFAHHVMEILRFSVFQASDYALEI